MRYAEALLIRAEAGAELGKDPELDKTINQLRARVGFTFKLEADPIADPDLIAKYPNVKGDNANLIRETVANVALSCLPKVIVGTTFVVGM